MASKKFCVIGLGYFGLNLALRLVEQGAEVLAIDKSMSRIELIEDKVTYAVCMDSTDERALRSLGVKDMDAVVVAIGEGFESSINTTAILQQIGVKRILNRVTTPIHERLLGLMNVAELLVPEAEAAAHLANRLMIPGLIESYQISKDYGIYEIQAPLEFVGKTVMESQIRQRYQMNLVTVKRKTGKSGLKTEGSQDQEIVLGVPQPDFVFFEGDILVLFGKEKDFKNLIGE